MTALRTRLAGTEAVVCGIRAKRLIGANAVPSGPSDGPA